MILSEKVANKIKNKIKYVQNIDKKIMTREAEFGLYQDIIREMQSAIPMYYSRKIDMQVMETKLEMDRRVKETDILKYFADIDESLASLALQMLTWTDFLSSHKIPIAEKDEDFFDLFERNMKDIGNNKYQFDYAQELLDMRSELYLIRNAHKLQKLSENVKE